MPTNMAINQPGTKIVSNPLAETLLWLPDNTYDVGANGANRPKNIYAGTSVVTPTVVGANGNELVLRTTAAFAVRVVINNVNAWLWDGYGDFIAATDNAIDIGQPGANRPRTIYAATSIVSPKVTITSPIVNPTDAATKIYVDSQIATLQSQITQNQTDIAALQSRVTALETKMGTAESNIASLFAHDNQQDQALSDLDHRVTALEQGGSVSPGGPFIGDLVHTKDADGHCQPSIVYEDWDGQNAVGTLSIAVLSPVRLADSPWDSYIEVHPDRPNSLPFTTWHWPEMAFQYRRNLFLKVAAHASRS